MTYQDRRNLQIAFVILDHALTHNVDDSEAFNLMYAKQCEVASELFNAVRNSAGQFQGVLEQMLQDTTPGLRRLTREVSLRLDAQC